MQISYLKQDGKV